MTLTVAGLKELYVEFASVPDAYITIWLTQAAVLHTEATWGAGYGLGMYAWTAHHLHLYPATGGDGQVHGPVSSENVGGISRSYADASSALTLAGDAFWRQSSYGLLYLTIRRTRAASRARVVSLG